MSISVKDLFINLTKKTMPAGNEDIAIPYLPKGLKKDFHGNYYMKIGDNPTVMFTSHLDTADSGVPKDVIHVFEGKIIKTDGKTILGADDKAGVALMCYMIDKKVTGLYYFFLSEERGCVGSRAVSNYIEKNKNDELYKNITKVISFDRKDDYSIITFQMGERCCSDEFADELAKRLNSAGGFKFKKDETGSVTDSHHFADKISECTNLSVGYDAQHTNRENQDIEFLSNLAEACCKIDWETLPVKRDYTQTVYRTYSNYNRGGYNRNYYNSNWEGEDDWWEKNTGYSSSSSRKNASNKNTNAEFVTDYLGNTIKTADAVWCEYDKEWCLKSEAIWVEYIGFYTCPDFDPSKVKKNDVVSNDDYKSITGDDIKVGTELYKNNELFGKITEIQDDSVTISTGEKSRFICPKDKILNIYNFQIKSKKDLKDLRDLKESDLDVNLIVHHPIFGVGKIVSVKPDKKVVKVSFKDKGFKDIRVDMSYMKF